MLTPTSAIMGAGLGIASRCSRMVDFLEEATASASGHITPEAQIGGPIALIEDGDPIQIDARNDKRTINVMLTDEQWAERARSGGRHRYGRTRARSTSTCPWSRRPVKVRDRRASPGHVADLGPGGRGRRGLGRRPQRRLRRAR